MRHVRAPKSRAEIARRNRAPKSAPPPASRGLGAPGLRCRRVRNSEPIAASSPLVAASDKDASNQEWNPFRWIPFLDTDSIPHPFRWIPFLDTCILVARSDGRRRSRRWMSNARRGCLVAAASPPFLCRCVAASTWRFNAARMGKDVCKCRSPAHARARAPQKRSGAGGAAFAAAPLRGFAASRRLESLRRFVSAALPLVAASAWSFSAVRVRCAW